MLPNFIGIGAPKAGTTWLSKCLAEHPEVFVAAVKETSFFDYGTIEGRFAEYEAHFSGSDKYPAVGEVSTRYLSSVRAPARIKRHIPDARLFASLRNPIDQIYSHYWHLSRQNFHRWQGESVPRTFEEALERFEANMLEPALYFKHLQKWLEHFDRSQLLVLYYDDIKTRPADVFKTLCGHLGVADSFTPPSLTKKDSSMRQGVSPKSPTLGRAHSYLYTRLNTRFYYPLKQIFGVRNAERLKNSLRIRPTMEYLFFRKGYPEMKPATRAHLRERLAEEINNLADLTGRDLSHWQ
jgi:hypothetical protein